jgi:outer membrane protein assembly factor BamB
VSAANGRIFEGSSDHKFYAFDAVTGAAIAGLYPKTTGDVIASTAAVASGQVFFGSFDDNLYGVHRHDGGDLQGFPVSTMGIVSSSPAVGDGQVIVGSRDGRIYSYDASSGAFQWSTKVLDNLLIESPVIANGIAYASSGRSLYALNEATGAVLWRASVPSGGFASPVVADGTVYIASSDGNLYAFSVNGLFPPARLPGGELGVKPAISSLKPDYSLKATAH